MGGGSSTARGRQPGPREKKPTSDGMLSNGSNTNNRYSQCHDVSFPEPKRTAFQLASETASVAHVAMGASAILDGAPCVEDHDDTALVIIDPQVDFHEGGSLAIAGATADSERIAAFIRKQPHRIDHIFVSLDTHHRVHIAHGAFWTNAKGDTPKPMTQIRHADVVAKTWYAREPQLQQWALDYTASLEEGGRFVHIIWPYHCVLGTAGHAVSPALLPALEEWSECRARAITWVLKGQNNRTEMYSALKAEVPVADDPSTLMNEALVESLLRHRQVVICGEAKSHCVNFTTRDLLSMWPAERVEDIVVLTDGTTPVAGFEAQGDEFFRDMAKAGVTLVSSTEFRPAPPLSFKKC